MNAGHPPQGADGSKPTSTVDAFPTTGEAGDFTDTRLTGH